MDRTSRSLLAVVNTTHHLCAEHEWHVHQHKFQSCVAITAACTLTLHASTLLCNTKKPFAITCRPWSRGGYTGHTELETALSEGQLLPGTVSWYSPRNHIGVHPESLLYNRDPEQLAEDVIGLASRNANLLQENVRPHCSQPPISCV